MLTRLAKFSCRRYDCSMKTLAEQVRIYMLWRSESSGRDFTAADLAQEVARHQKGVDNASKCKRQDIEHLLKREIKTPRYIAALAAAMGTTVEHLKSGNFKIDEDSEVDLDWDPTVACGTQAVNEANASAEKHSDMDPIVAALERLVAREGGRIKVADEIGVNEQSLYQILQRVPHSNTGKPRSVGPSIRRKLSARYPGWMEMDSPTSPARTPGEHVGQASAADKLASSISAYFAAIDSDLAPSAYDALSRFLTGALLHEDLAKTLSRIERASRAIRADENGILGPGDN